MTYSVSDREDFIINLEHIRQRIELRVPKWRSRADEIVERMVAGLLTHTPRDWRFTTSPSSRFFVADEKSGAKILGLTFRSSPHAKEMIEKIQAIANDTRELEKWFEDCVDQYIADVNNPGLAVMHHLRTAFGHTGALADEKVLIAQTSDAVAHTLPIQAKKLAARPNVLVIRDGTLCVRQYQSWMSPKHGSSECYVFQPLTEGGVDRTRAVLYSSDSKHRLSRVSDLQVEMTDAGPARIQIPPELPELKHLRSESYWSVPTRFDYRLESLRFITRKMSRYYQHKKGYASPPAPPTATQLVELQFLERVIHRARAKL